MPRCITGRKSKDSTCELEAASQLLSPLHSAVPNPAYPSGDGRIDRGALARDTPVARRFRSRMRSSSSQVLGGLPERESLHSESTRNRGDPPSGESLRLAHFSYPLRRSEWILLPNGRHALNWGEAMREGPRLERPGRPAPPSRLPWRWPFASGRWSFRRANTHSGATSSLPDHDTPLGHRPAFRHHCVAFPARAKRRGRAVKP
jgi:hypothetical protein